MLLKYLEIKIDTYPLGTGGFLVGEVVAPVGGGPVGVGGVLRIGGVGLFDDDGSTKGVYLLVVWLVTAGFEVGCTKGV